jgi:hypothetical protein
MSSVAVLEFLVVLEVRTCSMGCVSVEVVSFLHKLKPPDDGKKK